MAIKLWVHLVDGNDSSGLRIPSLEFVNPIVNVCLLHPFNSSSKCSTGGNSVFLLNFSDISAKPPPALFSLSELK